MPFCDKELVRSHLEGKTVAIVGSGPGALANEPGFVDSHDVVVRVNNYKLTDQTGRRTDVFYSFFGTSIKKTALELKTDGVKLCMAKCPDAQFTESDWHRRHGKMAGVDFRYIYERRQGWWFCPTYIPSVAEFMEHFELLGNHVPTTGFSAILDVLRYRPKSVYLTGFDFFQSRVHNVNEAWKPGNPNDPIGHVPDAERAWFVANMDSLPVIVDGQLKRALRNQVIPVAQPRRPRLIRRRMMAR